MKGKHPTVIEMDDRHWAVGVIEGIAVKVLTSRGHYTKAFLIFRDLMYQMEEYPLLDESDYCQREWVPGNHVEILREEKKEKEEIFASSRRLIFTRRVKM